MRTQNDRHWGTNWRAWSCVLFFLVFGGGAAAQEALSLKPDAAMERELKGGETHVYRVVLSAGQFLRAMVDQRGIDVVVTAMGPDGRQIVRADSPNGKIGAELLVLVAESAGEYRLEVSSPNKQAAAGRYEIRIGALREATPRDREQVAAERAFEEGYQKLRPQRTPDSQRAAIEKYLAAMRFYQASEAAEDRYRFGLIASSIGVIHMELSEPGKGAEYFNQALPVFRALGFRGREAATLNYLGGAADILGELTGALDYYGQALPAARAEGDRLTEVSILNNIGKIHSDLADWQKSLEFYNQALPLFRALGNPRREAIAIHNIGIAHAKLGEADKALAFFQQELPLRKKARDKQGEADAFNGIGACMTALGEKTQALEHHSQALVLAREAGDRGGEAETLRHIGNLQMRTGALPQARESFAQALPLARKAEQRRLEAAILADLGQASAPAEAFAYFRQSLEIFRAIGDRQSEANSLQGLARAERDRGNPAEARRLIEAAISLIEEVRARVTSGELRASYLATRQDAYQFHIDLLMRMHAGDGAAGYDALALQAGERARARSLLEMLTESRVDIREGVDAALLERERDVKRRINAKAARLLQRNSPGQTEELKKEIALLESEYQQVEAAIRKGSPHYAAIAHPEPLGVKEIQRRALDDDTLLLEYSLGEERSFLWAVTKTSVESHVLPGRESIDKAARRVTELLGARSARPPAETSQQRGARIAKADADLPEAVRQLSRMVLAPAAAGFGTKRLAIVADGALQYVPFAMLTTGADAPLIVDHEIVTLPSASTLVVMRDELAGRKPAPKGLAVLADPVFARDDERVRGRAVRVAPIAAETRIIEHGDGADSPFGGGVAVPRLPFTRSEADRILSVASSKANLKALDFNASRATAMSGALGQYRYLHFATHGWLDSERPGLSALVLSLVDAKGAPQDGFLRAHEIYNLKLPADLVVLSACQTGLGKEVKGEGLVGLTRGFMYAGAARVIVSLWNVNDRATSELMAKFYQKMLREGQRPAAALRLAQVEMLRNPQWNSPYYWAAFVLQGEWR